jgi:hypothetical protein
LVGNFPHKILLLVAINNFYIQSLLLPSHDLKSSFIDVGRVALLSDVVQVTSKGHGLDCYSLSIWRGINLPIGKCAGYFDVKALFAGDLEIGSTLEETIIGF